MGDMPIASDWVPETKIICWLLYKTWKILTEDHYDLVCNFSSGPRETADPKLFVLMQLFYLQAIHLTQGLIMSKFITEIYFFNISFQYFIYWLCIVILAAKVLSWLHIIQQHVCPMIRSPQPMLAVRKTEDTKDLS